MASRAEPASTNAAGAERIPCLIDVDLDVSRRGLTSVIAEEVGGRTVLDRVIDAVEATTRVASPVLLVHRDQIERARAAFPSRGSWFVHEHDDIAERDRLRRARLWGKEGWRGGIGDSFFFCEAGNPHAMADVCRANDWDEAIVVPAEAAFLDPRELDGIASHYLNERRGAPIYLSTAPPGIAGDVISRRLLEATSEAGVGLDRVYGFRLEDPNSDVDLNRIYHHFDEAVTTFRGRFTVDSRDALRRARKISERLSGRVGCRELFRCVSDPEFAAGERPQELIVELTGDGGGVWPARAGEAASEVMPEPVWARVLEAVAAGDESLLTFGGGYADPLNDPNLERRLVEAREAGALGLHVETSGARLDPARSAALLAAAPDAVTVDLTVTSGDLLPTFRAGVPAYEARVRGLERLLEARESASGTRTFVLASVILDERTAPHLDEFIDRWFTRVDRVLIRGAEGPRGEVVPSSLGCFAPPSRFGCVRLSGQMRIEHDGGVPLCPRDPALFTRAGDLTIASVAEVWTGDVFLDARRRHAQREWDGFHHCGPCRSWFRFD